MTAALSGVFEANNGLFKQCPVSFFGRATVIFSAEGRIAVGVDNESNQVS